MTQGITNAKLNNFEEMLLQTSKVSEAVEYGMDKTAKGFKNVLEKTLDKSQGDLNNESPAISKASGVTDVDTQQVVSIQDLKSSAEESSEKVIADVFGSLEEVVESEDDLTLELENETSQEENSDSEQNLPFEQLLSSLNTVLTRPVVEEDDSSLKMELNLDSSDMEQSEIINLSENLSDEAVSLKSMQSTETSDSEFQIDEDLLKELNIESVKAEVDTSTGENLMQNQMPEEYAVKAMINQDVEVFELKIDSSNPQVQQSASQVQSKPVDVNPSRIIDQITKHLEGLQNNSKISIVLNPESLGKVDIQLLTTKEGFSAQFTVATQEARDLLMKGLESLKETLMSQGFGVDNVSVKVAEGQKSEYKQDWTEQEGSRGGNKKQDQPNKEEKERGLFEKMMAKNNEEENGNV